MARWGQHQASDDLVTASGARIVHGWAKAVYNPVGDYIKMPARRASPEQVDYYTTLFYELVQWTGHRDRLAREFGSRFGTDAYAFVKLVAELGCAMVAADLGVTNNPLPHNAAYVANWLTVLRNDKKAIFTTAARASAAAVYLIGQATDAAELVAAA